MVQIISPIVASLVLFHSLSTTTAAPLVKRIAQVISDSTKQWEAACDAAGGGQQCNPISVTAFTTLLAAAGDCDQQNAADSMIDLAKQLNNDANMIKFAQIFAQQPRNSPTSLSVPYCQTPPKNSELNGLFQCQFQGTNPTVFVGNVAVGSAPNTIPLAAGGKILSPPQSCPAHTSGGIADGSQLVDVVQDPGVVGGSSGSSSSSSNNNNNNNSGSSSSSNSNSDSNSNSNSGSSSSSDTSNSGSSSSDSNSSSSSSSNSGSSTSSFALSNGQAAQSLNAQFASLTTSSPCTDGQNACINTQFAKCDHGAWVTFDCGAPSAGLTCAALPLVNSVGTSVTCTTMSDALARIEATGASGGFMGNAA